MHLFALHMHDPWVPFGYLMHDPRVYMKGQIWCCRGPEDLFMHILAFMWMVKYGAVEVQRTSLHHLAHPMHVHWSSKYGAVEVQRTSLHLFGSIGYVHAMGQIWCCRSKGPTCTIDPSCMYMIGPLVLSPMGTLGYTHEVDGSNMVL